LGEDVIGIDLFRKSADDKGPDEIGLFVSLLTRFLFYSKCVRDIDKDFTLSKIINNIFPLGIHFPFWKFQLTLGLPFGAFIIIEFLSRRMKEDMEKLISDEIECNLPTAVERILEGDKIGWFGEKDAIKKQLKEIKCSYPPDNYIIGHFHNPRMQNNIKVDGKNCTVVDEGAWFKSPEGAIQSAYVKIDREHITLNRMEYNSPGNSCEYKPIRTEVDI